jgi:hypothetical protein
MKTFIGVILIFLICIFLLPSVVSADAIAPNTHQVNRSVKFVNLDEFPAIVLIGYETGPQNYKKTYQIQNNIILSRLSYHNNQLSIWWSTKDKSISVDQLNINNFIVNIYPDYQWINNNDPLVKEDIQYSVAGFSDRKLLIYISKRTSEYNNGDSPKIETFNSPLGNSEPIRTPPSEAGKTEPVNTPVTVPANIETLPASVPSPVKSDPVPAPSSAPVTGFGQFLTYEQKFLFALLLTWFIEIIAAIILIKYLFKSREIKIARIVFVGLIASGLTLPYLWFILPSYISNRLLYTLVGEISIILVEAIIYYYFLKLRLPLSFVVSFVANLASFFLGIIIF